MSARQLAARALAALLLGAAGPALAACGSSSSDRLIPTADSSSLQQDFETVAAAAEGADGNCKSTEDALQKTEQDFSALPASVDAGLRERMHEGIVKLHEDALAQCAQSTTSSSGTTSTSKTSPKTTTPTTKTQTSTTQTTTSTTTTTPPSTETTAPPSTTPPAGGGGGTPVPEENAGGASPGGGTGAGEGAAGEEAPGGAGGHGAGGEGGAGHLGGAQEEGK